MATFGQASFGITTPAQSYDLVGKPQYRLFRRSYPHAASPSAQKSRHAIMSIICTYHLMTGPMAGKIQPGPFRPASPRPDGRQGHVRDRAKGGERFEAFQKQDRFPRRTSFSSAFSPALCSQPIPRC
jgi:hypothetical protein